MSSGSRTLILTLVIGIASVVFFGLMMENFLSHPEIRRFLVLHDYLTSRYRSQGVEKVQVNVAFHKGQRGTEVSLLVSPKWTLQGNFLERSAKVALDVFSFSWIQVEKERSFRITMPKTFVKVTETQEDQSQSRLVSYGEALRYKRGKNLLREMEDFLKKNQWNFQCKPSYSPKGWSFTLSVFFPKKKGETEQDLKKLHRQVLHWIQSRSFLSTTFTEFTLNSRWEKNPTVNLTTLWQKGKITWKTSPLKKSSF